MIRNHTVFTISAKNQFYLTNQIIYKLTQDRDFCFSFIICSTFSVFFSSGLFFFNTRIIHIKRKTLPLHDTCGCTHIVK